MVNGPLMPQVFFVGKVGVDQLGAMFMVGTQVMHIAALARDDTTQAKNTPYLQGVTYSTVFTNIF